MHNLVLFLISIFSIVLAIAGFFRLASALLPLKNLKESGELSKSGCRLVVFFIAWALTTGLSSLIPVWGYFLDVPAAVRFGANGLVGLLLLVFLPAPSIFNFSWKQNDPFSKLEKIVLSYIGFVLLLYAYRVMIPWGDHDETDLYGHVTKLMAGGWTFTDFLSRNLYPDHGYFHLSQSWDAQLYALVNDTYVVRFIRFLNLMFCGAGIYGFLRYLSAGRFWSLMGLACFLSTPELSYLATSLKIDAVVMMFELAVFLALIISFNMYRLNPRSKTIGLVVVRFGFAALLLSAFSMGDRFSGISTH